MITFKGSENPTIGIELELQIVDKATKKLAPVADRIINATKSSHVKSELFQSTVEIISSPHTQLTKIEAELKAKLKQVIEIGKSLDVDFVMSGTHPFTSWEEQKITDSPRYQKMIQKISALIP